MEELRSFVTEWVAVGWVRSALIVIASIIVAKTTQWILVGVLARAARRTKSDVDDALIQLLHRPIFASVLLVGLHVALVPLDLAPNSFTMTSRILRTLIVLVWLVTAVRLSTLILRSLARRPSVRFVDTRTLPLLDNSARVLLSGTAAYFVFVIWQINLTAWLASAGIIGIAVGFAAKDTLGNLFSGIFILVDAPYAVGDYVVLDQGERGQVTHIGIRSTRLLTRDDVEIIIPNSVIGGAKIINESGGPWEKARLRVKVGVAYGSDVDQVRAILLELAEGQEGVCTEPEPRVRFRAFGESSLDFELLCWIDEPVLRGRVLDALLTAIYKRFQSEGVEIPYPKRDVYWHGLPNSAE